MTATTHQEPLMTVLQGPHLSEKSHLAAESNPGPFSRFARMPIKPRSSRQLSCLFEVSVTDVTVINYAGKIKRHGTSSGRRAAWKKAYVAAGRRQSYRLPGS